MITLTFEEFQYGFAHIMSAAEARAAYERYAIPGPGRPIHQAVLSNLTPWAAMRVNFDRSDRSPLLSIAGAEDWQVPAALVRANFRKYEQSSAETEYKEFAGRSHLIMAQASWEEVAEFALTWGRTQYLWIASC